MRKLFVLLSLLVIASMVLAACGAHCYRDPGSCWLSSPPMPPLLRNPPRLLPAVFEVR